MPKGQIPWNKQYMTSTCRICGKVFTVSPSYLKRGRYKCCSLKCKREYQAKFRRFVYPDLELSPQLSYTIGVLIGDGCVNKYRGRYNLILNVTDEEFALSFKRALHDLGLHPRLNSCTPKEREKKHFRITAMSKTFGEWYRALGNEKVFSIATSYPLDFLRGFYESEGSASQYMVRFSNTDRWKLDLTSQLIESLGFQTSLYTSPRLAPAKIAYTLHVLGGKNKQLEFLSLVNPCIKRGRHESSLNHGL